MRRARGRRRTGPTLDRAVLAILIVALVLRVGLIGITPGFVPAYDAADYQRIAVTIAETGGYPPTTYAAPGTASAFRPPAWPYALAATKVIAGPGWTAGRLLGAALGTLSVLLIFLIGRELWDRRRGLLAAGPAAVFPPLIFTDTALLSEALFVPVMLAMTWALLRARYSPRPPAWIAAAAALAGLAMLTRSAGVVLLAPLAVAAWRAGGDGRRKALPVVLAFAVVACVLAPWAIRNTVAFDEFVPVSTQGGWSLAATYNSDAAQPGPHHGAARIPTEVAELRPIFAGGGDEADLDRRLRAAARDYLTDHPGYVVSVMTINTRRLWASGGPDQEWRTRLSHEEMGVPQRLDGLLAFSALASFLLGMAGVVVLFRRRRRDRGVAGSPAWLWSIPVLLWLSTVAISGGPRYRAAIDPFMLLLSAVALAAAADRLRRRRGRAAASP